MQEGPAKDCGESSGFSQHAQPLNEGLQNPSSALFDIRRHASREQLEQTEELSGEEDQRVKPSDKHHDERGRSGSERTQGTTGQRTPTRESRIQKRRRSKKEPHDRIEQSVDGERGQR